MSVDLHPEDLFDKEARGELSSEERMRLDAHLRACSVCRFERQLQQDFAAELAGTDLDLGGGGEDVLGNELSAHPEELFDKRARGELSNDERVRLAAHLDVCAACRFDERVRGDMIVVEDSPAVIDALVAAAMTAAFAAAPLAATGASNDQSVAGWANDSGELVGRDNRDADAAHQEALSRIKGLSRRRVWSRRAVMFVAAACLMLTGVAAGASGVVGRAWDFARKEILGAAPSLHTNAPPAASTAPTQGSSLGRPHAVSTAGSAPSNEPAAFPDVAPSAESLAPAASVAATPAPISAPLAQNGEMPPPYVRAPHVTVPAYEPHGTVRSSEPSRVVETSIPNLGGTAAPSSRTTTVAPPSASAGNRDVNPDAPLAGRVVEPKSESASTLFDRANGARRRGETQAASVLYTELQSHFPESAEARLSVAILARLALDRGNPGGALAGFDAYLRGGNPSLREEAMEGRALALERLGRVEEERRAWRDLLNAFPRSAYADHAEKRLHGQ